MKVLAIDIGYHNMGLVLTEFEDSPKIDVKYMKKVSLEDYKYLRSNDFVDLIPLFVEDHQDIFDSADKILIERQPPGGFTNIEILLNYMFKDKVVLISPVSMHMHFGMRHLDYEERKERTVRLAEKYMDYEIPYERKHDIADAFCMIVYYNFKVTTHIFDKFRFKDKETQDNMILTFSDKEKNNKVKSRPPGQIFVLDNIFSDDACLKMVEYIKNNVDTESKKNQTDINVRADSIILNKNQKWYEIISTTLSNVGMNIADKYYIGVCTMSNRGISDNISLRRIYGATKWHIDGPVSDTSNENARFQVKQQRCMSVVAALNSDYDGGELIFPCQDIKVKLKKGQVILFPPSWTHPHYTEELRNGTFRYTINTWLSI